jgi:hypothetical protein
VKFKVVIEHRSSSRSVGWIEAESQEAANARAARTDAMDWSDWHTEAEMDEHEVVSVTPT